jgi:hypothetical protein
MQNIRKLKKTQDAICLYFNINQIDIIKY